MERSDRILIGLVLFLALGVCVCVKIIDQRQGIKHPSYSAVAFG